MRSSTLKFPPVLHHDQGSRSHWQLKNWLHFTTLSQVSLTCEVDMQMCGWMRKLQLREGRVTGSSLQKEEAERLSPHSPWALIS